MALEQLLQASLPAKLSEPKPVSPTIMIGLGGTGKEVLLRLRRRLVERYGSLSMLPFLQFMHVDTDTTAAAHEQYDVRSTDDPLYQAIKFDPSERIELKIAGGTGKYIDYIDNFPQIKRWFPTGSKIAGLGDLGEGAGQVRMASRLGFFDGPNFGRINDRLEQCKGKLRDPSIEQRTSHLGFSFDPKGMNVFIIASLAGGTGSGIFLDMGFLVQRYFTSAERVGILFLPGFFTGYPGSERVRANGYAALTELNHYSFGHPFFADWDGRRGKNMLPPPFSTTYLIDGTNESNFVIGSAGKEYDAYQMVAEVLFQDYSIGSFAGMKRAVRINLVNFNLNVYSHNYLNAALNTSDRDNHKAIVGDTYPTRFGSFGLATISFPTDRVQGACASRLAARILDFWQRNLLEDPLDRLVTSFLSDEDVKCVQGRYERRDGGGVIDRNDIEEALLVWDAGGGRTLPSYLWQKAQAARTTLEAAPNGQKGSGLAELRNLLEQVFSKEDSELPEEWGVGIRQIETNMRLYLERTKAGIEKQAAEMANNPQFGVAYTLLMLQELKKLIRNENFRYLHYFEEQIPSWREAIQTYEYALDQLQMDISKHERQFLFRTEDLKRDFEKLVGDEGAEDLGAFYSFFVARARKQVAKRGRQICEEIERFLGADDPTGEGLIGSYYALLVGFEKLKDRLRAKERYFAKPQKSDLIISLYRDGDIDEWYHTWVGEAGGETESLKLIGNQILAEIFKVGSVTAALAQIQTRPAADVEAAVLEHCRKWIASKPKQPDALTILSDGARFTPEQRVERVTQAYRLSKVWLTIGDRGLEHTGVQKAKSHQRPSLIGVDVSSPPRLEEFKELIGRIRMPDDSEPSFHNIGEQNRGTIVFYNELAGVPAFYPSSVTAPQGLRAAYDAYADKEDLHTDKNRFQFGDLIPKEPGEARQYSDSLKAFVLARLLGLLRVREITGDGDRPTFHYSYTRVHELHTDDVFLGDESHAVDYLYREKGSAHLANRRVLLQMVERSIQTLRAHRMLWVYALLLDFYLKKVYAPIESTTLGIPDITATQYSPEYAVLDLARKQLSQVVSGEAEQKQLTNAIQMHRGKPLAEELTYDDFRAALSPYCKAAGKYPERSARSIVLDETEWRDVLALDVKTIDKAQERDQIKPIQRPLDARVGPDTSVGVRPCPNCQKPIDRRAVFCVNCKQTVARHIPCPHCAEQKVPDDLESCWKCGLTMRTDEKILCPRCFTWSGYEEEFPCKICGFDPNKPESEAHDAGAPDAGSTSAPPPGGPASGNGRPPDPGVTQVQCPTCYSMVEAGPTCSVCTAVMEI